MPFLFFQLSILCTGSCRKLGQIRVSFLANMDITRHFSHPSHCIVTVSDGENDGIFLVPHKVTSGTLRH